MQSPSYNQGRNKAAVRNQQRHSVGSPWHMQVAQGIKPNSVMSQQGPTSKPKRPQSGKRTTSRASAPKPGQYVRPAVNSIFGG